ncbi:MAG: retropepsin-like aspartic protease, partial [Bacteroidota bacterium]
IVRAGQEDFKDLYELEECVPFQLKGHFAVVTVFIDGKRYHFGIDTGAEANVINKKLYGKLKRTAILESHKIAVRGIDHNQLFVRKCLMRNIVIEGQSYPGQEFVFSDLNHLNKAYDIQLDGLLGYPFLKDYLYSLNYQNRELCFWQRKQTEVPDLPMTYHKDR